MAVANNELLRGRNMYKKYGPICTSEGFYQHRGECWSDALQMAMIYTDGIKEFTQKKLATQDVEYKEIEEKFTALVTKKLNSIHISFTNSKFNDYKVKNLRAIFLYFKSVQERFRRHYMAEANRMIKFGPVKCYSFEKMGANSLETLKQIALSHRASNIGVEKPGIRSAIMGKSENQYLRANREQIGKTVPYGSGQYMPGGKDEEIEYLLELYSIYFDIQLSFTYKRPLETFDLSAPCYWLSIKGPTTGHAIALLECGKKEYYYDDNEGIVQFPWRKFFSFYNTLNDKKQSSHIYTEVLFSSLFQMMDKKTGTVLFQTHTYPFILEKEFITEEKSKDTWHTTVTGFQDIISIEFPDDVRNRYHNTVTKKYEFKIESEDIVCTFLFTPKDKLYTLRTFMHIQNATTDFEKSTYNENTGSLLGSRLKNPTTNFEKAIFLEDKNTVQKMITEKYAHILNPGFTTNSETGRVLRPGINFNARAPNIPERDREGNTVVHMAVNLKDFDFLKWLLENTEVNINRRNGEGATPLALAILSKQYDIVKYLLSKNADTKIPYKDNYPIEMLIGEHNLTNSPESLELIEFMLSRDPENALNFIKKNLYYAFVQENTQLFDLFFKFGLNNNEKHKLREFDYPNYLTDKSRASGHIGMFKYFLTKGINKEQRDFLKKQHYYGDQEKELLDLVEKAPAQEGGSGKFSQTRKNRRTKYSKKRKTHKQ